MSLHSRQLSPTGHTLPGSGHPLCLLPASPAPDRRPLWSLAVVPPPAGASSSDYRPRVMHSSTAACLALSLFLLSTFHPLGAVDDLHEAVNAALPSDAQALLAFKASGDEDNKLTFPVGKAYDHCRWQGVKCAQGKVVRIILGGLGLRGRFGVNTLTQLDQLRVLSLQNNSLAGPLPDLSKLTALKSLFLDRNSFSGLFPSSILLLHRLRTLDLSHNILTGPLPPLLARLDRLYCLRLESNHFNGTIPMFNQSSLRIFNVSANNFTGTVPATPTLLGFNQSVFSDNPGLCGEVVHKQCPIEAPFFTPLSSPPPASDDRARNQGLLLSPPSHRRHRQIGSIMGFAAGILSLALILLGVSLTVKKMQKRKLSSCSSPTPISFTDASREEQTTTGPAKENSTSMDKLETVRSGTLIFCVGEAQVYTLEQLMRASAEMLGRGTMGTTYKAVLQNQMIVSVKRLDATLMAGVSREAFERHMESLGDLKHPNLVPLRAYFHAKEERLLVFDYQPNGSVFSLIHGTKSARAKPLHWTSCLKIAEDVAQGLAYIHQTPRLIHGNLKSANVLLGSDFEACLTDYCLSNLAAPHSVGDYGYAAPETRKSIRRATAKSDVYSFGVLLLELLTGRPPLQQPLLNAADLAGWVQATRGEEEHDERVLMLLDIAVTCGQPSPEHRPSAWQILKMVQEIKETEFRPCI